MLKIGIAGAGHLGKIHIKNLKEIPEFRMAGFYDISDESAAKAMEEIGLKRFDSLQELFDTCDVVDVVTPTISHFDIASKAIEQGKHVFIEKPLTHTLEEGKKLIRLAEKFKVSVQVGHVERFNPAFLAAQSYINNPMFIETHRLAQFNPRGTDVSVILDLMIHDLDIVLSLVKSPVSKISTSGVAVVSDTPDIANARIEFENGCVANLTASRISLKKMRKSRFFQRDAYIAVDFLKKSTEIVRLKNLEGEADPLSLVIDLGNGKGSKVIYFDNPPVDDANAIKTELQLFAKSILENTKPIVSIHDGYKAIEVAHEIIDRINMQTAVAL